ncbi:hypothetical protein [Amycolatopsis sp. NPDC003731]
MSFTTAFEVKRYLQTRLEELLSDYGRAIAVLYGPPAQDDLRLAVGIGNVEWESFESSSFGPRVKVYEVYSVECAIGVEQPDGSPKDTDATAEDIATILVEELRNNRTLGFNVDFTNLVPTGIDTQVGLDGGAMTLFKFNIKCEKNLA